MYICKISIKIFLPQKYWKVSPGPFVAWINTIGSISKGARLFLRRKYIFPPKRDILIEAKATFPCLYNCTVGSRQLYRQTATALYVQQTEQLYRQGKVSAIDDEHGKGCLYFCKDISSLIFTYLKPPRTKWQILNTYIYINIYTVYKCAAYMLTPLSITPLASQGMPGREKFKSAYLRKDESPLWIYQYFFYPCPCIPCSAK